MSISQAEVIVDRRQLKRRLFRWRILAVLAVLLALGSLFWSGGDFKKQFDHVARIHIDGLITGDEATLNLLDGLAKSTRVKGVIIRIDSPGGTTAGSEAIYEKIRKIARDKPVVAVMDTVAASGGYITAIAADHIVARGNTITGSIGVIFSFPEISKLLDTLGIKMEEIKSGELKAEPSPYKPVSDRVRQVSNEMVQESFAWFTGLVVERRKLSAERVKVLADGRVYTGRQAVTEKLIDALGGEEVALDWLQTQKNLPKDMEIVDWRNSLNADPTGLGFSAANIVLKALGFEGLRRQVESARLDGLLVLWHPQL
ncbi:MAG: signal peptide peptidase SppA [Aestuariivirga sp.]